MTKRIRVNGKLYEAIEDSNSLVKAIEDAESAVSLVDKALGEAEAAGIEDPEELMDAYSDLNSFLRKAEKFKKGLPYD